MKKVALILVLSLFLSSFSAFATDNIAQSFTNQEIVKEVAYAYARKGTNIHYDQATATARREINLSPEEATSQRRAYLDCSGYARAVYNEAFGIDILPEAATVKRPSTENYYAYAEQNANEPDVVKWWKTDSIDKEELKNEIRSILQIGDVFTLRYDRNDDGSIESGHTLVYVGENEDGDKVFLHCFGGHSYTVNSSNAKLSYDTEAGELESPSVAELKVEDILTNPQENYYLFRKTNPIKQICILRPLAKNPVPTAETQSRMLIKGLSMEKTSNPYEHTAVNTGDAITYTVTLTNTTDAPINANITDVVPTGTVFKESASGMVHNEGQISWNGSVPANGSLNISYTVTVTATTSTVITSGSTKVSGVKLGTIKHTLSLLTKAQIQHLVDIAEEYVEEKTVIPTKMDLAKTLYKEALGITITEQTKVGVFLNEFVNTTAFTCKENAMLVPDLFGGTQVVNVNEPLDVFDGRSRLVSADELSAGDCIYAIYNNGGIATVYMYLGNNTFVTVETNSAITKVTPAENIFEANTDGVLISLFGHEKFAIFRPSMCLASNVVPEEDGTGEPDEEAPISVGDALAKTINTEVTMQGYYVGVTRQGPSQNNEEELLIKDTQTNDIIAIRTAASASDFPTNISRKKGDLVRVSGTVKEDSTATNSKKYLLMSKTGNDWNWEVKSSNNEVKYDLSSVVTVDSQEDIINLLKNNAIRPYTYLKFEGTTYSNRTVSTYTSYPARESYRLHKNADAKEKKDFLYNEKRAFSFSEKIMDENLGANWHSLIYDDVNSSKVNDQIPGAIISKTFYALYTGGNDYYAQLVILDENWIMNECKLIEMKENSVFAQIDKAGAYQLVIADYEGGALKNVEIITKTDAKPGITEFIRTKNFALSKDDKVMLFKNLTNLSPLGSALIIE